MEKNVGTYIHTNEKLLFWKFYSTCLECNNIGCQKYLFDMCGNLKTKNHSAKKCGNIYSNEKDGVYNECFYYIIIPCPCLRRPDLQSYKLFLGQQPSQPVPAAPRFTTIEAFPANATWDPCLRRPHLLPNFFAPATLPNPCLRRPDLLL